LEKTVFFRVFGSFDFYFIFRYHKKMTKKLKSYFTASTENNDGLTIHYQKAVSVLKKKTILLSGEQIIKKQKLNIDKKLPNEKIFEREKKKIDESDCVIAEVTRPSTGVGGEIVYALIKDKPVLALFYKDAEDRLTPMLKGNPSENLYLEHYDDDNLIMKIDNFLDHIKKIKNRRGRLIVIDGGDGSGKATQAELLINYLKKEGEEVKYFDFPRYYSSFHGRLVGRFLAGEFGKLDEVSPYLASLAYALDRASVREEMEAWLKKGGTIVCNRYVSSNMAHQSAKLPEEKREEFLRWVDELEYRQHKMPRPDLILYLYVPYQIGWQLTKKKADKRRYVKGQDIAEKDLHHRREAEKMYLYLAKKQKKWVTIECVVDGKILPIKTIHQKIIQILKNSLTPRIPNKIKAA